MIWKLWYVKVNYKHDKRENEEASEQMDLVFTKQFKV